MSGEQHEHHDQSGPQAVLPVSPPAPGVQSERAVPLQHGGGDPGHNRADHDANPDLEGEGTQERPHRYGSAVGPRDDGEGVLEVGLREGYGAESFGSHAERSRDDVRLAVDDVANHPGPLAVPVHAVVGVVHEIHNETEVQIYRQPEQ